MKIGKPSETVYSESGVRELAIKQAIYAYADGANDAGDRLVELYSWLNGFCEFETVDE